jgi:hypothetical protein
MGADEDVEYLSNPHKSSIAFCRYRVDTSPHDKGFNFLLLALVHFKPIGLIAATFEGGLELLRYSSLSFPCRALGWG